MRVRYENTLEDLEAVNRWIAAPWMRRRARSRLLTFSVAALVYAGFVALGPATFTSSWPLALFLGAMAAVAFGIGPVLDRRAVRRGVEAEWSRDTGLGEQELELGDHELVHRSARGERRLAWEGVQRVVDTGEHLFLFTGDLEAHVVPRRAFGDPADADAFAARARERVEDVDPLG